MRLPGHGKIGQPAGVFGERSHRSSRSYRQLTAHLNGHPIPTLYLSPLLGLVSTGHVLCNTPYACNLPFLQQPWKLKSAFIILKMSLDKFQLLNVIFIKNPFREHPICWVGSYLIQERPQACQRRASFMDLSIFGGAE